MRSLLATVALLVAVGSSQMPADVEEKSEPMNLLLNPTFEFHSFANHRQGKAISYASHNVAFWNAEAWGDISVLRESHATEEVRPDFSTGNLVSIAPGKAFWQFFTLPEAALAHGEQVSLFVYGYQSQPNTLRGSIKLMKLDSEDGKWTPADYGMGDQRTFPRHSRGELVVAKSYDVTSDQMGRIELKIEGAEIVGRFTPGEESHSDDINTIGMRVEFQNLSEGDDEAWVCSPCLCAGQRALPRLPETRQMQPHYRYLPRTVQKLWKGEPIHVLLMGSSIDRGSANPPMYLYDEDPSSPTFKQPLADGDFDAELVGRPDLAGYYGWWRHYFSYTGRLRRELMRKFDLPASKLLFNYEACDGCCVGEAHSALQDYCSLSLPPNPNTNGQAAGKTWQELYPELFERSEGPGPDLVIFGAGANEKTDTPDEVAVFEGMIRWIQRHYPNCEFLFCMFQNQGGYTPNPGDLQALALRYQMPFMDYGLVGDEVTRWCNRRALVPRDGHPQAACHYLWFKQLERAFECWDPIQPGQAQLQLPERLHRNTYGWEGEMVTYGAHGPRLVGNKFIFEDTAINAWGAVAGDEQKPLPYVDGQERSGARRNSPRRDVRNSWFRFGNCRLGDRHILEIKGPEARLTYVDAKVPPDRCFFGVDSPRWELRGAPVTDFSSEWGAPYGSRQAILRPGHAFDLEVVATDLSVAYVDAPTGGTLRVTVAEVERLVTAANQPFVDVEGREHYMENRRGVLGLGFGLHRVRLRALDGSVAVLGLFAYDSRPNRHLERRLAGMASGGETLTFTLPFRARPLVVCHGGLSVGTADITPAQVTFSGEGTGTYEIIGE